MATAVLNTTDVASWSQFVTRHPYGHFMQSSEWGNVRQSQGWRFRLIAVTEGNEIIAGTSLLSRRIPGLGMTMFYSPRGPLFNPERPDTLTLLADEVHTLARSENALLWRADPYVPETCLRDKRCAFTSIGFKRLPLQWSYWNGSRYVMTLDTSGGADVTFSRMSSNSRNQIRHAMKNGIKVSIGNAEDMADFMSNMTSTAEKKGIPVHERGFYQKLYETFRVDDRIDLFLAKKGEEVISSGISIRYGSRSWLMYLGSDYSVKHSSKALLWEMIKWGIDNGCSCYDMQGTATNFPPKESDKGYGVYMFKKSFGAEITPLAGYYDYVYRPIFYRLFEVVERKLLPFGERLLLSKFNVFVLLNHLRSGKK